MKINIDLQEDRELRNEVKNMVRGQVKKIIKEELSSIIADELMSPDKKNYYQTRLGKLYDEEMKIMVKSEIACTRISREFNKEFIVPEIKKHMASYIKDIKLTILVKNVAKEMLSEMLMIAGAEDENDN